MTCYSCVGIYYSLNINPIKIKRKYNIGFTTNLVTYTTVRLGVYSLVFFYYTYKCLLVVWKWLEKKEYIYVYIYNLFLNVNPGHNWSLFFLCSPYKVSHICVKVWPYNRIVLMWISVLVMCRHWDDGEISPSKRVTCYFLIN